MSQVRYSGAVQRLSQNLGQTHLNFIEIGPYQALAGPIRQSLAPLQTSALSYKYIPTLVRGSNSCESLLETGISLFKAESELDIGAVAKLSLSNKRHTLLRDLPGYHWNHTTNYWTEPRLSR